MAVERSKELRRKERLKRRRKRSSALLIVGILFCAIVVAGVGSVQALWKRGELDKREQELQVRLEEEEKRSEDLKEYEAYVNSDEYVEDVAREKLGMAYADEIILMPKE